MAPESPVTRPSPLAIERSQAWVKLCAVQVMERAASVCVASPNGALVAPEAPVACNLAHPGLVRAYRYASRTHKQRRTGAGGASS